MTTRRTVLKGGLAAAGLAAFGIPEWAVPALAELCEVGFLLGETDEVVLIGMEHASDGVHPGRWRLHVPKSQILERHDVDTKSFMRRGKRQ